MEPVRRIVGSFIATAIAYILLTAAIGVPFWPVLVFGWLFTVGFIIDFVRDMKRSDR